jgi:putative membrane protein
MNPARRQFKPADLEAVARAIGAAEKRTSGEIVVSVVAACDDYAHALWKGAALGALAGILLAGAVWHWELIWHRALPWIVLPAPLAGLAGYLLVHSVAPLHRWLVTPRILARRTRERALAAFVKAEMFKTEGRTGILLFLALFEHRVEVVADEGINATVKQSEWDEIAAGIAAGMRQGRAVPALLTAIEACGALLERYRLHPAPRDRDELSNRVRIEDEP